jgi:hypothetical protein
MSNMLPSSPAQWATARVLVADPPDMAGRGLGRRWLHPKAPRRKSPEKPEMVDSERPANNRSRRADQPLGALS